MLPSLESRKPVPPLAQIIREHPAPVVHVGFYNMSLPSLVYYADHTVEEIGSLEQARAFFLSAAPSYALTTPGDYAAVHALVPATCVAGETALFPFDNLKLSAIRRNEAAPEVLLVSNRCPAIGNR